jgi:hypothetical protein
MVGWNSSRRGWNGNQWRDSLPEAAAGVSAAAALWMKGQSFTILSPSRRPAANTLAFMSAILIW